MTGPEVDAAGLVMPHPSGQNHAIHTAAERGDLSRVRALLDSDPSLVHLADRSGGTPLHRAALGGSARVTALLLDRGADIDAIHGAGPGSSAGYAPERTQAIDLAIWGGPRQVRPPALRFLWLCGRYYLSRALGRPFRGPRLELARLLIARGAAHDLPTAAALGDIDRVTAILDADPSRLGEARPTGRRALTAAIHFGHDEIARLLLQRGFDPCWPEVDDEPQGAAIHTAARLGNRPLVELLLDHGANPSASVDSAGNAVFAAKTSELRKYLISRGGRLDPYDLVWLDEDDEVMRRVTEDPASATLGCGGVFTAVVTTGKRDLLRHLLDAGLHVPPVVDGCHSYLLERPDMLKTLLASGMSPDTPTADGVTFLHDLCRRDERGRTMDHRTEVAAILLEAGAAISPRERQFQSTPLAWAAHHNLPDMVEFLLSRGAPTNLPDDRPGATPLACATRNGHTHIVDILRRAGATP